MLGRSRKPCPDGCTCKRHDREARRAAAQSRWDNGGQPARDAQAEVCRAVANARWSAGDDEFAHWMARVRGDLAEDPYLYEPVNGLEDHRAMAAKLGVKIVQTATLRRYGLTELEWLELLADQGWRCPICLRRVTQYVTDHEHVKGWKALPPSERKRYVRGVLCVYDNYKVVPSKMTAEEAARMVLYIRQYEERRDG